MAKLTGKHAIGHFENDKYPHPRKTVMTALAKCLNISTVRDVCNDGDGDRHFRRVRWHLN